MTVEKKQEGTTLTVVVDGRVDTITAPALENELTFDGVKDIVFDLAKVDYISSAGLRVLVRAQKRLTEGGITIANACSAVREVFDVVGFSDAFTFA